MYFALKSATVLQFVIKVHYFIFLFQESFKGP